MKLYNKVSTKGILIMEGTVAGRKRESLREKNLGTLSFFSFKDNDKNQSTISGLDIKKNKASIILHSSGC